MKLIHFFEKIDDMDMGDVIKDFYKSDAKQFKGKSKKKRREMAIAAKLSASESIQEDQSYDDLRVAKYLCYADGRKFKPYGIQSEYIKKAEEMRINDKAKYDNVLSQPSPPSDDSWASKLNNSVYEDIDLNDGMIGTPDNYYDEEERKEAYADLKDTMDEFSKGHERESVIQGICPNCAGSGYQDAEYPEYDDDGEEIEDSFNECDGYGMYGCDEGEMTNATWVEIIKHDDSTARRQQAKDEYPGDEVVINQIAKALLMMDDPREMYQYMKADYPQMGRAQRSDLISKGMEKAGLTKEGTIDQTFATDNIDKHDKPAEKEKKKKDKVEEGEERQIIEVAMVNYLVKHFSGYEHHYETKEEMESSMYDTYSTADIKDIGLEGVKDAGQLISDYTSSPSDVLEWQSVEEKVMAELETNHLKETTEIEVLRKLSGIKEAPYADDDKAGAAQVLNYRGKQWRFDPARKIFTALDGEEASVTTNTGKELMLRRQKELMRTQPSRQKGYVAPEKKKQGFMSRLFNDANESFDPTAEQSREEEAYYELMNALDNGGEEEYAKACGLSMEELDLEMSEISRDLNLHMDDDRDEIIQRHAEDTVDSADWKDHGEMDHDVNEDAEGDASEVAVSKMIAKALGDENRWTEMSSAELYAELESENTDMADVVKDVAKMVYGVQVAETK